MSSSIFWRVPHHANLIWRRWPGETEYVFYHGASGDTHRLSELAGVVMEMIFEGKGEQAFLTQWLQEQGDVTAEATMTNTLDILSKLDFIETGHAPG